MKYCGFFIENLNSIFISLGLKQIHFIKLLLPLGISFYTFETITYVVDVYRRVHKPLDTFWDYQLYIILFPKLIAGPIIRYHELADQLKDRRANETIDNRLAGFYRFSLGLAKKVLIANQMGQFADPIFSSDFLTLGTVQSWIGILAYTFQIYFDFSGYSDMAIGLAKLFGFKFPENFNNPYISASITEFWRRWHISLSNWMKNYLYIPLGGNRVSSKIRLYFNLWLVFLISGLWHGASWNFVFWGIYHGFFLVIERAFLLKIYEKVPRFIKVGLTFLIIVIGWVFFRTNNMQDAFSFLKQLCLLNPSSDLQLNNSFLFFFILAIFFSFIGYFKLGQKIHNSVFQNTSFTIRKHITLTFVSVLVLLLSVSFITSIGFNPFIYFRF
jgi:alginate O-acetyltransferase complex protein AlgI